jgi:sugar phosphate isomerase/epimerase
MANWKYAISYAQVSLPTAPLPLCGDLEDNLRKAARHGYVGLEIHGRETVEYDYDKVKKIKEECGAGVKAIVSGRLNTEGKVSLLDESAPAWETAMNGVRQYIRIAEKFGANVVIGWVKGVIPKNADRDEYLEILGERLVILDRYGKERGVKLYLEVINHYETNIFNTASETLAFVNKWSLDNTFVHLDTYHMNIEEASPYDAILECGDKLGYFHVSDNHRRYPGSGQLDFKKTFASLNDTNYDGLVTLECLPYPDRDTTMIRAMEHLKKCEP